MNPTEKARLLIASVNAALAEGTKHFNKDGKLLTSTKEILQCLRDEGAVQLHLVKCSCPKCLAGVKLLIGDGA